MKDALDFRITVTEMPSLDQPVDALSETIAVFVGRTLRGPLHVPVGIDGFAEFRRVFGGDWSRSGMSEAVRQFFEHGGSRLCVVRVANAARGAMLCLPAAGSALVLRAVEPGSSEILRAAVDYDGIDDDEHFNLTLQRLDPESGLLIDQECHTGVSYVAESPRFVAEALSESTLAVVESPLPTHRPEATGSEYIDAAQSGNDGEDLTDYDLIGSRARGTGLFALTALDHFDLLYFPAGGRRRSAGPTAIMAAEMYCRERGAMLIIDPDRDWQSDADAVDGMRGKGFASPNLVAYYPAARNRETQKRLELGGAIAGMLCRLDREHGAWHAAEPDCLRLSRRIAPLETMSGEQQQKLWRGGINVLLADRHGRSSVAGDRTLGRGNESHALFARLSTRRTVLRIVNTLDLATRWAVFARPDPEVIGRVRGHLATFLACLADLEAFDDDDFSLDVDVLPGDEHRPGLSMDLAFTPRGAGSPVYLTLEQTAHGFRVVNTAFARQAAVGPA